MRVSRDGKPPGDTIMSTETATPETSEQDGTDYDLADVFETPVGELDRDQKQRLLEAARETDTTIAGYADELLKRYEEGGS